MHVCGLQPTTTEKEIDEYLRGKSINNIKCEKITAKRPDEYASFKISVPNDYLETTKQPELWPSGVRVNRFLERIYKKKQET